MVALTTPQTTYTATATMSGTTHTRFTLEDRALSTPVLAGLAGGFISMLAGLTIQLQAPPSCLETVVASLAIVTNNLWAATAIACPVAPPHALYLFRTAWSVANTMTLVALVIVGAFYPSRGEASPLAILGIFVLELIGLLAVSAAAALSSGNDDEMSSIEDVAPDEDASSTVEASLVEETIPEEETSPVEENPEENLTPEQHMQRSREMLERAETLLINFGAGVHQLNWSVNVFRGTIQEINSMYPGVWDPSHQRQDDYYDEDYPENDNDSGFLAAYRQALARQGIYDDPNQHLVDESSYYSDYPEDGEDERGYYDDYVEEEDNEFYHEDQYASESEETAHVEEIEWAGEPAHVVHPEDAESDESSTPDLVADGGMVIV